LMHAFNAAMAEASCRRTSCRFATPVASNRGHPES
jgi:hypothetical protein